MITEDMKKALCDNGKSEKESDDTIKRIEKIASSVKFIRIESLSLSAIGGKQIKK